MIPKSRGERPARAGQRWRPARCAARRGARAAGAGSAAQGSPQRSGRALPKNKPETTPAKPATPKEKARARRHTNFGGSCAAARPPWHKAAPRPSPLPSEPDPPCVPGELPPQRGRAGGAPERTCASLPGSPGQRRPLTVLPL